MSRHNSLQNDARDMRLARKAATTPKEYKVPTSIEFVKTQDDSTTSFETVPELDDSAAATMPRPDYEEALKTPSQRPRKLLKKVYPQSPGGDTVETAIKVSPLPPVLTCVSLETMTSRNEKKRMLEMLQMAPISLQTL